MNSPLEVLHHATMRAAALEVRDVVSDSYARIARYFDHFCRGGFCGGQGQKKKCGGGGGGGGAAPFGGFSPRRGGGPERFPGGTKNPGKSRERGGEGGRGY